MSDFRVPVYSVDDDADYIQELDWDREMGRWTLSERDLGLGARWFQGANPLSEQMESLLQFFRIKRGNVRVEALANLSPGELALLHQNTVRPITVHAVLCGECEQHWYVFRWNYDKEMWEVYGRTCDFSWRRGYAPTEEEAVLLGNARGLADSRLRSPE